MELKLNFSLEPSSEVFSHKDKILLMGSCFSDEMAQNFQQGGFRVVSNPFGTLFHPLAINTVLESSLNDVTDVAVYQREDLYFSWDGASTVFGYSEQELVANVLKRRQQLKQSILESKVLVFTFGTAHGYRFNGTSTLVGNCHKAPADHFSKELTTLEVMKSAWESTIQGIKKHNPSAKIIFTVSPVRHKKDGLVENNRSKARLIELVHQLVNEMNVRYFPSYEIVMDELRDYRFFKSDMVHPSEEAINYVWSRFIETYCSPSTRDLIKKVNQVKQQLAHTSIHTDSLSNRAQQEAAKQKSAALLLAHPYIQL